MGLQTHLKGLRKWLSASGVQEGSAWGLGLNRRSLGLLIFSLWYLYLFFFFLANFLWPQGTGVTRPQLTLEIHERLLFIRWWAIFMTISSIYFFWLAKVLIYLPFLGINCPERSEDLFQGPFLSFISKSVQAHRPLQKWISLIKSMKLVWKYSDFWTVSKKKTMLTIVDSSQTTLDCERVQRFTNVNHGKSYFCIWIRAIQIALLDEM